MIAEPAGFDWAETAAEVDRLNRTDARAGLDLAARWFAHEQAVGTREGQTRAMRARGHAVRSLGQYDAAISEYEEVEARFDALGLHLEAAGTQIGHVTALRYKGRYAEALDLAERSRAVFQANGDDFQVAKQLNNFGTIYRPMGRYADALRAYQEARVVFRRLDKQAYAALVEQNMGNVLVELGRFEEALRCLRAAERIRRRLGLRADEAQTLLNIGILSRRRGDYGRALEVLTEAGRIFESLGDRRGARLVDLQVLPTSVALNLREESRRAAERSIDGLRELDMPWELGQALLAAGALAELDGELAAAGAHIDEARRIFGRLGNRVWEALARLQRARLALHPDVGALDSDAGALQSDAGAQLVCVEGAEDARPSSVDDEDVAADGPSSDASADPRAPLRDALAECRAATAQFDAAEALDHAAFGRLVDAALLARLADAGGGDHGEALARYREVLHAAARIGADHLLYQAHAAVGDLLASDDPDAAIDNYRRAIDHLETVRARALADDLKLSFLAGKTDLYERVVGLLIERGSDDALAEAYGFVERSKSRTLLEDLLGGAASARHGRQSRVVRLAQRVRDLRTQLNEAYVLAYGGDAVPSSDSVSRSDQAEAVARLERDFARATRDLQLAARGERPNGVVDSPGGARSPLPAGVALVEYFAVGSELLAFVDGAEGLRLRRVSTLDDVALLADRLNFHIGKMSLGEEYVRANLEKLRLGMERCLQQLYRAAFAPIADDLAGYSRVVIVPHGPLHGLPFHAFHDGTGYLAERFTIGYAPSTGIYQACASAGGAVGERAVVLGIDDPGLPWVGREIDAVAGSWPDATVLRGRRATRAALKRRAGHFDVLHLATHGVFRADNPAFSSIKLSDAWLTVNDLAELARGAQLVTLSACETGVSGLSEGDEVVGLTRGILAAGCSTVVASLWTVSDESTARLMERFYAHLRATPEPAAALRSAMLDVRAGYDHPYYWAAFVAIGGGV